MNKHDVLRAKLLGQPMPEGVSSDKISWAMNHAPLLSPHLFAPRGRRLNRFTIGSDPEFAFINEARGGGEERRLTAVDAGLHVGLAAGADQNERLVELRPWPSHSVVEHVAGILTALRWLYRVNLYAYESRWRAGAYFAGDGMGGHIHFGRKRPTRGEEVAALDGLAVTLRRTGLFSHAEWTQRTRGDRYHNAPYGKYGDFRVQQHGYEYRTLPSWLQSPLTAFICITLSKLAVIDPTITTSWIENLPADPRGAVRGLAKLYKGRDDDAYILYHALTTAGDAPFVIDHTFDFKTAWGIPTTREPNRAAREADQQVILPGSIKPHPEEVQAVLDNLLFGQPIQYQRLAKTFRGEIPQGYTWAAAMVAPGRRSGFGDFLHNLVFHSSETISFQYDGTPNDSFIIAGEIPEHWTRAEEQIVRSFHKDKVIVNRAPGYGSSLTVPKSLCQAGAIAGLRAMIFHSGLFPFWTVESVQADSQLLWLKDHPKQVKPQTWRTV